MIEPIRRHVSVRCDPATAFRVFTHEMDTWWPLHIHSRAAQEREADGVKAERIVVEELAGGRIYEVMSDGLEADWGTILVWEPPERLVLAWQPNGRPPNPTELELRFAAEGEGTRVDLEHRGWEVSAPTVARLAKTTHTGGRTPSTVCSRRPRTTRLSTCRRRRRLRRAG
jgi:uncharacterized protein YndB with AHSA1/START domain